MNKKMNNKGFSLVELIIVIAIMAVLVGVLAPQFLKYVERSRKSTDVQTVSEIVSAVNVYVADPANGVDDSDDDTLALTCGGTVDVSAGGSLIKDALKDAGISKVSLKSKEWDASGDSITFKADIDGDGAVTYSVTGQATGLDILKGSY